MCNDLSCGLSCSANPLVPGVKKIVINRPQSNPQNGFSKEINSSQCSQQ